MDGKQNLKVPKQKQKKKKKSTKINVDSLVIQQVISELKSKGIISKDIFRQLIIKTTSLLKIEANVIKSQSPVIVVGDIHGQVYNNTRQFYDLLQIFERYGYPPDKNYLFLGDYVDRGMFGIQVLTLLCLLKLKYRKRINLLRGNHESYTITVAHNFQTQCKTKYDMSTYGLVISLFQSLPLCCIVDSMYFCVHGGISPQFVSLQKLQTLNRHVEVPQKGILCDLLWSDPTEDNSSKWTFNKMRSCSYYYALDQAENFLRKNKLKLIIRGHQIQLEGYKYQECKNKKIKTTLTLFSAPNYCDKYKNLGAVAIIQNGTITISSYKQAQHPLVLPNFATIFEWSMPYIANCATQMLIHIFSRKIKSQKKSIKTAEQIKNQVNALQQMEFFQKICRDQFRESEQVFVSDKDKTSSLLGPIESQMGNVLKFLLIKEKDKEQGFPLQKQQKKQQKQKSQDKSILQDVVPKNQKQIIGPHIKNFVRIRLHPEEH